mmetsp:Transcript_18556/g.33578  ORF Transcript_18556/g.33578 Transcript_18556/m.33578 type:complete len:200 (-) Transcript_18556:405-1004(-)
MRSHGAIEKHRYTYDSRRMAYYAVGRTNNQNNNHDDNNGNSNSNNKSPGGGNRRCYFTGNVIPYGMPFYAGSVQQGPRTLVVFCLPSALGLPSSDGGVDDRFHANNPLHRFSNKADREMYLESLPETDTVLLEEMSRRYLSRVVRYVAGASSLSSLLAVVCEILFLLGIAHCGGRDALSCKEFSDCVPSFFFFASAAGK